MTPKDLSSEQFAKFCGQMAESFGFGRSIGQIFGLLFIQNTPLSLIEIAKRLHISKGNASINLRILESWGAVFPVFMSGSRQDHYEANKDIKALFIRRVKEGLLKRIDLAEDSLNRMFANMDQGGPRDPSFKKKMEELKQLLHKGRKGLDFLPKLLAFLG